MSRILTILVLPLVVGCDEEFAPTGVPAPTPEEGSEGGPPSPDREDEEPGRRGGDEAVAAPEPSAAEPAPEAAESDPAPPQELGPAWAADQYEPNDSCAGGAAIGEGEHIDLTLQEGNPDWYRITLCPEGSFTALFAFDDLQGRVEELLKDDSGADYGGGALEDGGGGTSEVGMAVGGRTYCLGYQLSGPDLHYSLTVRIDGC